jgi:hypothetical protein
MVDMTYEERRALNLKQKQDDYIEFQKKLNTEVLNKYGYTLVLPLEDKINTDRGFFTNVTILFKEVLFATLSSNFDNSNEIKSMYMQFRSIQDTINTINYSNSERGLDEIEVNKHDFTNIQSALDELEKVRKEIVKFYN